MGPLGDYMGPMVMSLPPIGRVIRRLGHGPRDGAWRQIGCGVKSKDGLTIDYLDQASPTCCLVWVLRGSGTYADDQGATTSLAAGDVFLRWPGRRHTTRLVPDSGWYEIYLNLGDELPLVLERLGVLDSRQTVWHLGLDPVRLDRWLAFRDALARAEERDLPGLCLQAQALIVEALAAGSAPLDPVAAACAHLGEHLAEREDLQAFCRKQGLDYETFRKRFRREVGCSPGQYRIHRRLDRACALLNGTTWPVARIATELGYASAFDFSAQFRRHLGLSPRTYRARQS